MPRISQEEFDELWRRRNERNALDFAIMKLFAFECAMRVLAKHDLMVEFSDEIKALSLHERRDV